MAVNSRWAVRRNAKGFVFDNEKWAHPRHVANFAISSTPTCNADYLAFVDG
jgi:formylglycine-generating enzyme required for sulfatase activity